VWDLNSEKLLYVLSRHHYGVIALEFSPSGEFLASGGYDNKINVWNVSSGAHLTTWSNYPMAVIDLKWSPNGKTLAVAGGEYMGVESNYNQPEKYLQLLNTSSWTVIDQFVGHEEPVHSITFSKDGQNLVSGSWDGKVKIWDTTSAEEIKSFSGHEDKITSISYNKDESKLISGSLDKTVKIWDIESGYLDETLNINQSVWSISHSPIESLLAVAVDSHLTWPSEYWLTYGEMHDCSIQLWNLTTFSKITDLEGHTNTIESVKFSRDGEILASASWDWSVKLWGSKQDMIINEQIDEWELSNLEELGFDSAKLQTNLEEYEKLNFHSILIVKNGKLGYEKYYYDKQERDFTLTMKHTQFSATKSYTSALIGIAIDKAFIKSVNEKVLGFFPKFNTENFDPRLKNITLHHLLTMTSGLEFDDYLDIWGMAVANDSVEYILSRDMFSDPGEVYKYNTGSSQLLSAIIQKATGTSTFDFAMKYLFEPLEIERNDIIWVSSSDGVYHGGSGMFVTPRNMAKFGLLYLNEGIWDGKQIISKDWIKNSSRNHIQGIPRFGWSPPGYGYHFWVENDKYYAMGYGGQSIQILNDEDMVIVTTAREELDAASFISNDIVSALLSDENQNFHQNLGYEDTQLHLLFANTRLIFIPQNNKFELINRTIK
jgi:CubicO group peptidase (beta-lactamase class C family)